MKKPFVAIVDDDSGFANYLRTFLSLRGYDTRSYSRGDEMLASVKQGDPPDIVLLDVMMPGMNGIDTLRALKSAKADLQVIMLSGREHASTIVEAVRLGAADYVVKPDDPVIQRLLQVNFEMEDYVVLTAGDGEEGLEVARKEKPDIVLLDVMMPKMNGISVARALREDPDTADLPIIMLTAKAQAADIQAGQDVGVDVYVTKPFDPLELIETVRELIG